MAVSDIFAVDKSSGEDTGSRPHGSGYVVRQRMDRIGRWGGVDRKKRQGRKVDGKTEGRRTLHKSRRTVAVATFLSLGCHDKHRNGDWIRDRERDVRSASRAGGAGDGPGNEE